MKRGIKLALLSVMVVSFLLPMLPMEVEAAATWSNQFVMYKNPAPILWYGSHYHSGPSIWRCYPDSGNHRILQNHDNNIKVSSSADVVNVRVVVYMKQWAGESVHLEIRSSSSYPVSHSSRLEVYIDVTLTEDWTRYEYEIGVDCKGRYVGFMVVMDDCESGFYFHYQHPILQIQSTGALPW